MQRDARWPVVAGALTFGAGALDVLALTKLGRVFASVMTGNLALLGLGLARADAAGIVPAVVTVAAYAVGVGVGTRIAGVHRTDQHVWPPRVTATLMVQLGVLCALGLGWSTTHAAPTGAVRLVLLPANEPGSSIMPGKVNPTQCEALVMISIKVIGNDTAVALAGSQGNFELNAMRPVIINDLLHSARILGDGCGKFLEFSVRGTTLNPDRIGQYLSESLMLVIELSPVIGYQNAAHIAEDALANGTTLRAAAIASGHVTADQFDAGVNPLGMVGDGVGGA